MKTNQLGLVLLVLTLIIGIIFFFIITDLNAEGEAIGCFPSADCAVIQTNLSLAHFAVGVLGFFFSLGFFLLFLSKDDEKIMKRLDDEKNRRIQEDKFSLMLRMIDANEQKVLKAIKDEPGITQSTLVIKSGLSKSKVSEILTDFEKKNIIKRVVKGKTRSIYLVEAL